MTVDLDGPEPIYRQIAAALIAGIKDGTYPVNRRLPSEAEICEEYGVSRKTARAAIALVVEAGHARTVRGKGTYVLDQGNP